MDWGTAGEADEEGNAVMGGVEVEMPPGGINNSRKTDMEAAYDASGELDSFGVVSPLPVEDLTYRFEGMSDESCNGTNSNGISASGDKTSGESGGGRATGDTGNSVRDADTTAGMHPAAHH